MADVTIRGIDDEVYARFTGEAKKRGISIGELTNIVMRALVDDSTSRTYRIGELVNLSVSKKDLESLDGMVAFCNMRSLEFANDIDWETFDKHVSKISNTKTVLIPPSITEFQVLTKCKFVGRVTHKKEVEPNDLT